MTEIYLHIVARMSCEVVPVGPVPDTASRGESEPTMRAELIGHFEPCMTEVYLHIYARTAH